MCLVFSQSNKDSIPHVLMQYRHKEADVIYIMRLANIKKETYVYLTVRYFCHVV